MNTIQRYFYVGSRRAGRNRLAHARLVALLGAAQLAGVAR